MDDSNSSTRDSSSATTVRARDVANVGGDLADVIQVAALARRAKLGRFQIEGECDWFIIGVNCELPGFDHMPIMPHCSVDRKQLSVECAVIAFGSAQLL